jgi:hypothetical protein
MGMMERIGMIFSQQRRGIPMHLMTLILPISSPRVVKQPELENFDATPAQAK